ncbi:hypothetical protein MTR67_047483 [Solanum verrucosum]|uniref:Uncharacterized protein n=1 Tax=Solanum verrucosum TaxID=315347 RepID=A0AAF0UVY0_SOLVR|nr:hypothetical protein MTR67_047483 [Solanum verrucosum]
MPLGAQNKEIAVWSEVLERCNKKLARWKSQYLSLGERKKERKKGGLGIKKLNLQNNCLLQKWLWRFCIEDQSLWKRVITMKYGLQSHWITEEALGTFGCSVWKTIRRLWPQFKGNISLKVGNGRKIDFWNEHWIGDESLQSLFPDLFMLTTQNKATISQLWSPQGWNLISSRAFNDWEIERVINLFQILNAFPGTSTEPDKPIWRWQSKATSLWNMFLGLLGVCWVIPKSTKDLLYSWKEIGRRESNEDWWEVIPACIWWSLWK